MQVTIRRTKTLISIALMTVGIQGCYRATYSIETWRAEAEVAGTQRRRSELAENLVRKKQLIGQTKEQVEAYLGSPDRENDTEWVYVLGRDPSFGIDMWEMHVSYDPTEMLVMNMVIVSH